jgi:hypothetical protein
VSDAGASDAGQPGFAASAGGEFDAGAEDPEIEEAVLAMAAA